MLRPAVLRALALLFTGAIPCIALGDKRELYTELSIDTSYQHSKDPVAASRTANAWGYGLSLVSYYGLTNTLHAGGALRVSRATNVSYSDVMAVSASGTANTGTLYSDVLSFQVGALGLYRLDTRSAFAPTLALEGGLVHRTFSNIALNPTGASYSLSQPANPETLAYGRATVSFEYRFSERFLASVGIAGQFEPGGLMPWQVSIPLSAGLIW